MIVNDCDFLAEFVWTRNPFIVGGWCSIPTQYDYAKKTQQLINSRVNNGLDDAIEWVEEDIGVKTSNERIYKAEIIDDALVTVAFVFAYDEAASQ